MRTFMVFMTIVAVLSSTVTAIPSKKATRKVDKVPEMMEDSMKTATKKTKMMDESRFFKHIPWNFYYGFGNKGHGHQYGWYGGHGQHGQNRNGFGYGGYNYGGHGHGGHGGHGGHAGHSGHGGHGGGYGHKWW